jgi:hypothetical protein
MWPTHTEPSGSLLYPASAAGPPRGFGGGGATPCGHARERLNAMFDVDRSVLSGIEHEFDSRRRSRSLGSGLGIKDESRAPEERSYHHFWPNF